MKKPGIVPKVENAKVGWRAKVRVREYVLEAVTPARAVVFDAFAGPGLMWAEVWKQAAGYVGCDEQWHADVRCSFVADNRRVLRCIDLSAFTVFDFDAYGGPWEQLMILAARRHLLPGERVGLAVTEGTWSTTRMQRGGPTLLRRAAGLTRLPVGMGTKDMHDELIAGALRRIVRQMGGTIVRQWRAEGVTGARMRYLGLIVEGNSGSGGPRP